MYIIFVQNVWICRKIDCLELRKFNGKLCSLNLQNVRISREIEYPELRKLKEKLCTLYMHGMADLQKIWIFRIPKIQREIVYIIYIYGMSGFLEKLNLQNYENSTRNSLQYICTEFLDL